MGRIGLVLGAGGVVGHAFHAGVLAALQEETGWDARGAELIVGTSAGSGVAALLRAGLSPADLLARATGAPLSADGARLAARVGTPTGTVPSVAPGIDFPRGMAAPTRLLAAARRPWEVRLGTLAAAVLPAGRVSSELIAVPFRSLFDAPWPGTVHVDLRRPPRLRPPRRLRAPGRAAGVDRRRGGRVLCHPLVLHTGHDRRRRYVDGGAHSPTNVDVVAAQPLDLVIVSSPMSSARWRARRARHRGPAALPPLPRPRGRRRLAGAAFPWWRSNRARPTRTVMGLNAMDASRRKPVAEHMQAVTRRRLQDPKLRDRLAALSSP